MKRVGNFFRCECGKVHIRHGVTESSKCTCGKPLYPQMEKK